MQVKNFMSTKPDYISPSATLKQVATEMQKNDIGFTPVSENGKLLGVITDRDIATRAVAKGRDPNATLAKDIMTANAFFCYDDDDIEKAAKNMSEKQIRRLVVLDHDRHITGVISLGDIAAKNKDEKLAGHILHKVCEKIAH